MKQKTLLPWIFILLMTASLFASARAADGNKWLGTFQDWHAQAYKDGARSGCYIISEPKSEKGNYTKRGDVYVLVSISSKERIGIGRKQGRNGHGLVIGYRRKQRSPPAAIGRIDSGTMRQESLNAPNMTFLGTLGTRPMQHR